MDIVTAIFVTNVKILASVRLKGSRDDIRVKIPTSDIFIHSIYIESAQQIFYDPFLFHHKNNFGKVQENKHHIKDIINYSIDETIRQMLPFDDILQKYLADALNDNAEFGEGSDSEESVVSDSDEESLDNGDFPSDEESVDSEPEVKQFNLNEDGKINNFEQKKPFQFINDPDSGSDSGSEISDDEPTQETPGPTQETLGQPPPTTSPFNFFQSAPPPQQQQPPPQQQPQQPPPQPQQQQPPPQPQPQQQIQQQPQQQGYSFFS
jgi:hypothetical protein